MPEANLSRGKQLKFPQFVSVKQEGLNTEADFLAAKHGLKMAQGDKFCREKESKRIREEEDLFDKNLPIPEAASDLMVITKIKKAWRIHYRCYGKVAGKISRCICQ